MFYFLYIINIILLFGVKFENNEYVKFYSYNNNNFNKTKLYNKNEKENFNFEKYNLFI
jgi:intein-encoded DNA endonuclease-like protein